MIERRIRVILTSYEIVWATLRSLPSKAYLELDVHPAPSVGYTFILEIAINRITPNGIISTLNLWGYKDQSIRIRIRAKMGAPIKGAMLDLVGEVCSLVRSFSTSAKGWGIPAIPTLLGPFRSCMYPSIFRSSSVKKAIASIAPTIFRIIAIEKEIDIYKEKMIFI